MKYCANCGSPLDAGEKFCPECGTKVNGNNSNQMNNQMNNNHVPPIQNNPIGLDDNLVTVIGFFCLLLSMFSDFGIVSGIIAIIIGIYLYTRSNQKFKKYGKYLIVLWIVLMVVSFIEGFVEGFFTALFLL